MIATRELITSDEVMGALQCILEECPNGYAKAYTLAYLKAVEEFGAKGASMQIPYILGNMQHWRGEKARAVKATLKRLASEI